MNPPLDMPNPEWIRDLLREVGPLRVLFCHGCHGTRSHEYYPTLREVFKKHCLDLLLDPFPVGSDIWIAMEGLRVQGLLFHSTTAADDSEAVQLELAAAARKRLPVSILFDGGRLTVQQRKSAFLDISSGLPSTTKLEELARGLCERATFNWVVDWALSDSRSASEREAAAEWIYEQDAQLIAEFLPRISAIQEEGDNDPALTAALARSLGKSDLSRVASSHLYQWKAQSTHPLAVHEINNALERLKLPLEAISPAPSFNAKQAVSRGGSVIFLVCLSIFAMSALVAKSCHPVFMVVRTRADQNHIFLLDRESLKELLK